MKTIKIGNGRYVMVISDPDDKVDLEQIDRLWDNLNKWWASGDKFYVIMEVGTAKIRVERAE